MDELQRLSNLYNELAIENEFESMGINDFIDWIEDKIREEFE